MANSIEYTRILDKPILSFVLFKKEGIYFLMLLRRKILSHQEAAGTN